MRRIDRFLFAAVALFGASPALACTVSTTPVSFGAYDTLLNADDASTGTFTAACPIRVRSIVVAIGAGSSGNILDRTLVNAGVPLDYNLYTDPGHTFVWGDGSTGNSVTLTPINSAGGQRNYSRTIYGLIPRLQPVGPGTYTDTVIVTVTF